MWEWRKLVIDGRVIYVFPKSKFPKYYKNLCRLVGIEIHAATGEERKPFFNERKNKGGITCLN